MRRPIVDRLGARLAALDWGRLVRFGLVGTFGAGVYFGMLWLLVDGLGIGVLVSTSISFVLVTLQQYFLHFHWTWVSDREHGAALPRFAFMNIAGFWINWTIMYVGVTYTAVHYLLVQAVAVTAIVIWNYLLSHYWIFRPKRVSTP
jgi:putative flippase GtrA